MRIEEIWLHRVGPFQKVRLSFPLGKKKQLADTYIFVGANGCGKSTLLYALAAFMTGVGLPQLDQRFQDAESLVGMKVEQRWWLYGRQLLEHNLPPQTTLKTFNVAAPTKASPTPRFLTATPRGFQSIGNHFSELESLEGHYSIAVDFVAFAYSSSRSLESRPLQAVKTIDIGPLSQALSFDRTIDSGTLVQWIANILTKHALAIAKDDVQKAKKHRFALSKIEAAVSKVINQSICFELDDEPLSVKLKLGDQILDLNVLPDGLKSILSWVSDLLMRLDRLTWRDDTPIFERSFALFLDEIEIHLHPKWQREILPAIQSLFPNAMIFMATHSPFVVASAEDAWIYDLKDSAEIDIANPIAGEPGKTYERVLREIFSVEEDFDRKTQSQLEAFHELVRKRLGGDASVEEALGELSAQLIQTGEEAAQIVNYQRRVLERQLGVQI